jgi:hypothetical protein
MVPDPNEPLPDPAPRRADAIVDSRLHIKQKIEDVEQQNLAFTVDPANRAHLASQLLLYEHVVIPTNDFAIISALINWMGLEEFEEALDNSTFSFLRRRALGYSGNGVGLIEFLIESDPQNLDWWRRAVHAELPEAIELQLLNDGSKLPKRDVARLVPKIVHVSKTVEYKNNEFFMEHIVNESYKDIRDTPELCASMEQLARSVGNPPNQSIIASRVPGIAANRLEVAGDGPVRNPADLVVRVAETNIEMYLAEVAGGTDLHVSKGAEKLLYQKIRRAGSPPVKTEGFSRLLEITNIPDVRVAVASRAITLRQIMKVRRSRRGRLFREWLVKADATTVQDLERQYRESVEQISVMESVPIRVIRVGLLTELGFPHPFIAAGAAVADSLFTEKYIRGYRPKLMFDELRKLLADRPINLK